MTTFSATISQSSDDAQEAAGTVTINGGALNANSATGYIGVRFNNVTIPQGATINTATMDLYFTSGSFEDPDVTIYGEDADDAATFTTAGSSISSRAATTATTTWNVSGLGTGVKTTPDFASVVQEIVDRVGWSSGNDMVIIFKGNDASTLMRVRSYDAGGGDYATINVDYTATGPQTLTGVYISAGTTLYAGTIAHNNKTLTGAYISATTTLYAGVIATAQVLTGVYVSATTALYSGFIHNGPIRLVGMTHHEISEVTSTSFQHETPAGDDRLLVVVATYTDTAGIASLVFGSNGTGDGEFNGPVSVAVSSLGIIYVGDAGNYRIQYFDDTGAYVGQWGSNGTGNGEFGMATYVAVSPSGDVYVCDRDNNRIQKFDSDGTYISKWGTNGTGEGQFDIPMGITVSPDGDVYVCDSFNHRVQKFDSDGVFVAQWGSVGIGEGQFTGPRGIAISPGGDIYVCDVGNNRVQKFNSAGVFIAEWGSYGTGNGQFDQNFGVVISQTGFVYVVDYTNRRIQQFDADGVFINKWGNSGIGDGQLSDPVNIAVSPDGAIYVADNGNNRIQKFDAGLKINTAYYGTEPMEVGPLVDAGSYYQAFYTLANPTVGSAEVVLTAPTGPDKFMITAMSFVGVETATVDYTAPDAGRAEASTTALQISHSRTYPARTLSLWALLYETASTTLTAAANNFHLLTRTLGTLNTALGLRVFPSATSGSQTFGATASPAVTQKITAVLHLEPKLTNLTAGAYISPTTTLYAGTIAHAGQTLYGAYISPTTALYAGQVDLVLTGAYIAAGTTLYAGTIAGVPGPDQTLTGVFIGVGLPSALGGAYISPATEFFAGVLTMENTLEGAYIEAGTTLYAGTLTGWDSEATGQMWAGTISHV